MEPEDFLESYAQALASQDWSQVEPLVHPDACVTFSKGREKVGAAFSHNFSVIQNEQYAIENVRWVRRNEKIAVCLFDYRWKGIINGEPMGGEGRGTHVIVRKDHHWQMLVEHLGPKS